MQASNNKLFGHGIQGDRFLLKNNRMYGDNVSNGFIYAFISGGYGSLAILIFFVGIFFFYLFKLFILNKVYLKDMESYRSLSIIIIIFFFIRILFENSFVIFSLDLLVILPCMFTLLDKYELKKNEG